MARFIGKYLERGLATSPHLIQDGNGETFSEKTTAPKFVVGSRKQVFAVARGELEEPPKPTPQTQPWQSCISNNNIRNTGFIRFCFRKEVGTDCPNQSRQAMDGGVVRMDKLEFLLLLSKNFSPSKPSKVWQKIDRCRTGKIVLGGESLSFLECSI
jgi:hypothetical protein